MQRIEQEELLDSDHWSPAEVACALGAIRRVNLFYGGDRMHTRLFDRISSRLHPEQLEILEVASAHADVLQAASRMLMRKNISLKISLLDRSALHLPSASDWDRTLPQPTLLIGDALEIPLKDRSVDVVSCCLFLHHLSEEQARAFLKEALRVARVAVLINDVERCRRNYFLSHLYKFIDPSKLSRHDGPVSVRQAYTFAELKALLHETGREFELQRGFLFRLGAILWKNEPNTGCALE